jgi:hypothetical protein
MPTKEQQLGLLDVLFFYLPDNVDIKPGLEDLNDFSQIWKR